MSGKITKTDLIDELYNSTKLSRQEILQIIDAFCNQLKTSLGQGSTIEIRGFGTFEPRLRKGRSLARNPKTGEKLSVPSHYTAVFRPGKDLKLKLWALPIDEN